MRIYFNLYGLKNSNGMFYFAADYARVIDDNVVVLARRSLVGNSRSMISTGNVLEVGGIRLVIYWLRILLTREAAFVPSPHPFPFISRQLVVVHDSYPFQGRIGRIKKFLFRLALATSRCKVAYINHSDSKRFVESCVNDVSRHVFLPNHFPGAAIIARRRQYQGGVLTVGLVGTDSAKKNYATLFAAVVTLGLKQRIRFMVFGHDTTYFREVRRAYPQVQVNLALSDSVSMDQFFVDVDCLASVARNEGFGRPVAHAISSGVPCFLIEDEVFREFYTGFATFAPTAERLLSSMLVGDNHAVKPPELGDFPPSAIQQAIVQGVTVIRNL